MEYMSRKRQFRRFGRIVDAINLILSTAVIVCAVLLLLNTKENMLLFPVIFLCTALMNLALAIKNYKRRETFKFIVQIVAFLGFIAFGIFTLIVVI